MQRQPGLIRLVPGARRGDGGGRHRRRSYRVGEQEEGVEGGAGEVEVEDVVGGRNGGSALAARDELQPQQLPLSPVPVTSLPPPSPFFPASHGARNVASHVLLHPPAAAGHDLDSFLDRRRRRRREHADEPRPAAERAPGPLDGPQQQLGRRPHPGLHGALQRRRGPDGRRPGRVGRAPQRQPHVRLWPEEHGPVARARCVPAPPPIASQRARKPFASRP